MAFDVIKYINGSTCILSPTSLPVAKIDGMGLQSNPITISAPSQEGETYLDKTINPRTVTIEFTLLSKSSELEAEKNKIATCFNPRKDMGTLKIIRNGSTYCLDCKCADLIQPGGRGKGKDYQRYIVTLVAPDPYFYLSTPTTVTLTAFTSGFEFPFEFPFSVGVLNETVTVNNLGNVPTPVEITFTGGISEPRIENGDDIINLETDISEDETLYINTKFGNKQMKSIIGTTTENAFSYASTDTNLWYLSTGENVITYLNSGEVGNSEAKLVYYTRYNTI